MTLGAGFVLVDSFQQHYGLIILAIDDYLVSREPDLMVKDKGHWAGQITTFGNLGY